MCVHENVSSNANWSWLFPVATWIPLIGRWVMDSRPLKCRWAVWPIRMCLHFKASVPRGQSKCHNSIGIDESWNWSTQMEVSFGDYLSGNNSEDKCGYHVPQSDESQALPAEIKMKRFIPKWDLCRLKNVTLVKWWLAKLYRVISFLKIAPYITEHVNHF